MCASRSLRLKDRAAALRSAVQGLAAGGELYILVILYLSVMMHEEPEHPAAGSAVNEGAEEEHAAAHLSAAAPSMAMATSPHAAVKSRLSVVVGGLDDRDAAVLTAGAAVHGAATTTPVPPSASAPTAAPTTTTLRVHCATFNMAGRLPPSVPDALVGASQSPDGADLLAFATQVCVLCAFCPARSHDKHPH